MQTVASCLLFLCLHWSSSMLEHRITKKKKINMSVPGHNRRKKTARSQPASRETRLKSGIYTQTPFYLLFFPSNFQRCAETAVPGSPKQFFLIMICLGHIMWMIIKEAQGFFYLFFLLKIILHGQGVFLKSWK